MEQKQLTPQQAFEVLYSLTGTLTLNRHDGQVLDNSLRVLAQLLPQEEIAPEA
ncbi:hypothetical protein OQZ33_07000 [Pedobacter sp. MC2016-05]|uniref:hypothetical protein n=1 Tax=Pedobacter sp. MC2016-05 TaxID=2994474 RepID=UPI002247134F|nr:hypothetical protein [Pedobacter sp. MC2016-05]MCX2474072.1 hypothetical protein [Pedobacter sp. MC2016-05]